MIVGARRRSVSGMRAARHVRWKSPLEIAYVARPEPAAGEVRVAIRATSVNPIDMHTGRNAGYEQSMRLPFIPGWDVAGVVDALGYGVTRHSLGDRVFGLAWFPYPAGTYAQYVNVPAYQLVPAPTSATFEQTACLPMAALTAWQMLDSAAVTEGQRVLISGASGGVGHIAVQLAAARGAKVIALARNHNHAILLELGADECVDYTDSVAVSSIRSVDAVIDLVGHKFGETLFDCVREGGSVALATAWSISDYETIAAKSDIAAVSCLVEPDPEALRAVAELVDTDRLRVIVGAKFDLDRAAEAQQWVKDRRVFGKVAVVIDPAECHD